MWQQKVLDQWNQSENTHKPLVKFLINHNQVLFVATETIETITIISINYEKFIISKDLTYKGSYLNKFEAYYVHEEQGKMTYYETLQNPKNTKNKNERLVLKIIKNFRKFLNS